MDAAAVSAAIDAEPNKNCLRDNFIATILSQKIRWTSISRSFEVFLTKRESHLIRDQDNLGRTKESRCDTREEGANLC